MAPAINWGHFCMWVIETPISLRQTEKKQFHLNLNVYRNANFRTLAKAKTDFAEIMKPRLAHLPKMGQIHLLYTLYMGSRRLADTANICCIVDKFFSDCLVSEEIISDDNYTVVLSVKYRYGGYDKSNPRVEVAISPTPLDEPVQSDLSNQTDQIKAQKDIQMKITVAQKDIETAIRSQIASQVTLKEDQEIDVLLRATRGPEGFIADVTIGPKGSTIVNRPAPKERAKPGPKLKNPAAAAIAKPIATKVVGKTETVVAPVAEPVAETVVVSDPAPTAALEAGDVEVFNEGGEIAEQAIAATEQAVTESAELTDQEAVLAVAAESEAPVAADVVVPAAEVVAESQDAAVETVAEPVGEVQPAVEEQPVPEAQPAQEPADAPVEAAPAVSVVDEIEAESAPTADEAAPLNKPKSLFGNLNAAAE